MKQVPREELKLSEANARRLERHREAGLRVSPAHRAFRQAAALLPEFDPEVLRPADGPFEGSALYYLFKDCDARGASGKAVWSLKQDVRQWALRSFAGPQAALEALEANPSMSESGFAGFLADCLRKGVPGLAEQGREELAQTQRAVRWLSLVPGMDHLPSEAEVFAALERKAVFEPFEVLLERGFFGREEELDRLRNHVGVLEAEQLKGQVQRHLTNLGRLVSGGTTPPLLISGPGGVGKSTLIAKFLEEHLNREDGLRIPFAYLDFERSLVTALEPMTLLAEACRQLASQMPLMASEFAALERRSLNSAERQEEAYRREFTQGQRPPEEEIVAARRLRDNRRRRERAMLDRLTQLIKRGLQVAESFPGKSVSRSGRRLTMRVPVDKRTTPLGWVAKALELAEVEAPLPRELEEIGNKAPKRLTAWLTEQLERKDCDWTLVAEGAGGKSVGHFSRFVAVLAHAVARSKRGRLLLWDGVAENFRGGFRSSDRVQVDTGKPPRVPFLVVLDSFERTQYRSYRHLVRMWSFFDVLQKVYPAVRVVVSGRAPVKALKLKQKDKNQVVLENFSKPEAAELLVRWSGFSKQDATDLVQRFGGNPLTLHLLARLGNPDVDLGVTVDGGGLTGWLGRGPEHATEMVIQGMLYERILGQIDHEEVRELVHPGLVLRRITPSVIREVLSIGRKEALPADRAEELFLELERQVDLVETLRPGVLGHRPEIRAVMLQLLESDKPEMVAGIERAAVNYYSQQPGPEARAEEIYHRLRLLDPLTEIADRWEPGVERYLTESAVDEVPEAARTFLETRVSGLAVDLRSASASDLEFVEEATARQVEDLLVEGLAEEALDVLDELPQWTGASPLFALKARVLDALGDRRSAERHLADGIVSAEAVVDSSVAAEPRRRLVELRILAGTFAAREGEIAAADEHLVQAWRWTSELGDYLLTARVLLLRLRLRRPPAGEVLGGDDEVVKRDLIGVFHRLDPKQLALDTELAAEIALEVGSNQLDVLVAALDLLDWREFPLGASRLAGDLSDEANESEQFREWLRSQARRHGVILEVHGPELVGSLLADLHADGVLGTFVRDVAMESLDSSALRDSVLRALRTWLSERKASITS